VSGDSDTKKIRETLASLPTLVSGEHFRSKSKGCGMIKQKLFKKCHIYKNTQGLWCLRIPCHIIVSTGGWKIEEINPDAVELLHHLRNNNIDNDLEVISLIRKVRKILTFKHIHNQIMYGNERE
jgi:hypothetical protein